MITVAQHDRSTRYGMGNELLYLPFIRYMAFKIIYLFLFLAEPGLHCCPRHGLSLVLVSRGCSLVGFLISVVSLVSEHGR